MTNRNGVAQNVAPRTTAATIFAGAIRTMRLGQTMSEYIPSIAQVRRSYDGQWDVRSPHGKEAAVEFDLWLAANDRVVAAKAWEACLDAIDQNELNTEQARNGNPYRAKPAPVEPETQRTRTMQANEIAYLVIDQAKIALPKFFVTLDFRYGIADALWDLGYRRSTPLDPEQITEGGTQ
jgi:hypothetical protein